MFSSKVAYTRYADREMDSLRKGKRCDEVKEFPEEEEVDPRVQVRIRSCCIKDQTWKHVATLFCKLIFNQSIATLIQICSVFVFEFVNYSKPLKNDALT